MNELTLPVISKEKKLVQIADFLLEFNEYNSPAGLQAGDMGVAIFLAEYARYANDDKYLDKALELINTAFNLVESREIINSFCSGLSGMAWGVNYMFKEGLIEGDAAEVLSGVDGDIASKMLQELQTKEYDYMHRGSGPMMYFLSRLPDPASARALEAAVDTLDSFAVKENGEVKWRHDPEYKLKDIQPRRCLYNLGLSHGVPSLVAILSFVHKAGIRQEKCTELIEGAVKWILSCKLPEHYSSIYSTGTYEDEMEHPSRLGWCYGDLGVALALWHAANALQRTDWKEESLATFKHAAKRLDIENAGVQDAGICHGSAGLSHIFYKMHLATQDETLLKAAEFWLNETLKFDRFEDGYCGYKSARKDDYECSYSVLEGAAGIGATLLAQLSPKSSNWDRMFLIS